MRKRLVALFCCVMLLSALIAPTTYAASGSTTVYITDTGAKYHTSSCSYLRESMHSTTLQSAIDRGYTPCSRCSPPRLTSSSDYSSPSYSSSAYGAPNVIATPKTSAIDLTDYPTKEASTYTPSTSKNSTAYAVSTSKIEDEGNNPGLLIFFFLIICVPPLAWAILNAVKENADMREAQRREEIEKVDREFAERQRQAAIAKAKREEEERQRKEREAARLAEIERKKAEAAQRRAEEERRKEEERKEREAQIVAERNAIIEALNDPRITEWIDAPDGDIIDLDGLPNSHKSDQRWGDKYTFYVTSSGKAYHQKGCRFAGYLPVNAYELENGAVVSAYCQGHVYYKCSTCNPELPDMLWVKRVEEINNDLRKHGISRNAVNLPEHLFPRR